MVDKIRPLNSKESPDVLIDDEAGGVIVIPWVWDANAQQYVVQTKGSGAGESVFVKRDSDGALINPARAEDITALQTAVAKETTLAQLLTDFNGEDFATQFTLAQLLTAFNAEDFATQTTLEALRVIQASIQSTHFRRTDPLAAGTNRIGSTIPDRPSQGPGRTYAADSVDAVTSSVTVYTVTASKKLYITSWGINARNTSTINMGHLRLRDGGPTGEIIASWTIGVAVAGTIAPSVYPTVSFKEPKQFSTDLYLEFVGGSVTASFQFTGYEEVI